MTENTHFYFSPNNALFKYFFSLLLFVCDMKSLSYCLYEIENKAKLLLAATALHRGFTPDYQLILVDLHKM